MPEKPPGPQLFKPKPGPNSTVLNWHGNPQGEFYFYARSFHKAAKTLVENLELDESVRADWDACPVVFLYRHAAELYLKSVVFGKGHNFLSSKPDMPALYRTHSLRTLTRIVSRIVMAVGWQRHFSCEGVANLADFQALIAEFDLVDPGSYAFRYPVNTEGEGSVRSHFSFSVRDFAERMDAVLDLLDVTVHALAATWDQRAEALAAESEAFAGDDSDPTIQ
jgi:hypothetical protein